MSNVVGRFAPSPSGPLHLGSLLAALGSYLQARAQGAQWLLRVDDLDTPRIRAGAEERILDALIDYGLRWDGVVFRQSTRGPAYQRAIEWLKSQGHAFDCGCTRREARSGKQGIEGPVYPGTCRRGLPAGREARSVRFRADDALLTLHDRVQGRYQQLLARDIGDFVIQRADGITAYQLATVLDDAEQGVTEVVRGADLLSSTPRQMAIYKAFGLAMAQYAHLPVLIDANGYKLSKSSDAPALEAARRGETLFACLELLGQRPPQAMREATAARILRWATDNWTLEAVPARAEVTL